MATMNRRDFQQLALIRLRDARVLLASGQFDGAYYLSGYVLECAIKSCIAKLTKRYDFPDRQVGSESIYTHNLTVLVRHAGLTTALASQAASDARFEVNWNTAKDWSEQSRYATSNQRQAEDLLRAITERRHGVLNWLRRIW
jgi:hypothetical protein